MPHMPSPEVTTLLARARIALGLTQKELGELLRASMRTANRWESGQTLPSVDQIATLAQAVHPRDATLAAALAAEAGTTLEALGLVPPPRAPQPASAPPAPPPRPFPPVSLMLDSVLLAAMDAAAVHTESPLRERAAIVDVLRAAVTRSRGLGLTLEELEKALSSAQSLPRNADSALGSPRGLARNAT